MLIPHDMEQGDPMASILKKWKKSKQPYCCAVIVAAGTASRMNGVDKIVVELGGIPVIARTLSTFEKCALIDEVVVVTRSDLIFPIGDICRNHGISKVSHIVEGGADRIHSVLNGIAQASPKSQLIAIHDGARPFITQAVLKDTIATAMKTSAAAPAIAVNDTIKQAADGIVTATPDRAQLFAVQTPQVFDADLIRGALYKCVKDQVSVTDDCSAVEYLGKQVVLTKGDRRNIKITTQFDLLIGEAVLACRDAI